MKAVSKILHTTCHKGWGGLEKRILNESVWMEQHGYKIILVVPKDTPLYQKAKKNGLKVYGINFKFMSALQNYNQLLRIIYNEQPDAVNTHGNKDAKIALLAAKRSGVPLRILSRHISAPVHNTWLNRLLYRKWPHYIFTTAGYTSRHLKSVFKLSDMQVFSMPSGIIEPESLPEPQDARLQMTKEQCLSPETRFIGFVGRVGTDKGVGKLVEAFGQVKEKLPGHCLLIVGDGHPVYLEELRQLADQSGLGKRIFFTGFRENIWPCYRALDCCVLPSQNIQGVPFEGVPQSLLEAMYAGCPVIGSNSGGITDIIEDQVTGLLFNPDSPSEIAARLLETLSNKELTAQRVQEAKDRVDHHHTINAMGQAITRIYSLHQVRLENSAMI